MNSGNFLACAKCNELETIKCERCHEAPPYENQPIHKSYYYLVRCQVMDCADHTKACNIGKDWISLSRAACLMKDMMLVWRKIVYPECLEFVDRIIGSVIFKLASPKEESMRRKLKKFMVEMEEGDVRDGILLRNAYSLAAMELVNFMQVLPGRK